MNFSDIISFFKSFCKYQFICEALYTVAFGSGGNGSVTGTASQTVSYGNNCTAVTAAPNTGYRFVNWTGTGGFVTTTTNPLIVAKVTANMTITANFHVPCDANGDGEVDLADAILALRVVAGLNPPNVFVGADSNGDEKIGIEEVVYILQKVAGVK